MKVRMVIIGGFLGAGKTTLITRLARDLKDAGVNVGIIMNDRRTPWSTPNTPRPWA